MSRPICIVILPDDSVLYAHDTESLPLQSVYDQGIEPAILRAGFDPVRVSFSSIFVDQRLQVATRQAPAVVAEVSKVFEPTGFALGLRKANEGADTTTILVGWRQNATLTLEQAESVFRYDIADDFTFTDEQARNLRLSVGDKLKECKTAYDQKPVVDAAADPFQWLRAVVARQSALRRAVDSRDISGVRTLVKGAKLTDGDAVGMARMLIAALAAVEQWEEILETVENYPEVVRKDAGVRDALAIAHQNSGNWRQALEIAEENGQRFGWTVQRWKIVGDIHQERWVNANETKRATLAKAHQRNAVQAYLRAAQVDWTSPYAGVNAISLAEGWADPALARTLSAILPAVRFSAYQRAQRAQATAMDLLVATEAAILSGDEEPAGEYFERAKKLDWTGNIGKRAAVRVAYVLAVRASVAAQPAWAASIAHHLHHG